MELPNFSSLYEADLALTKLKESLDSGSSSIKKFRNPHLGGKCGPAKVQPRRSRPQYVSDGICGVNFGIWDPGFANPVAVCCQMPFFTEQEYDRHVSQHVSCPGFPDIENSGCGRELHPSTIAFHLEVDHCKKDETKDNEGLKKWRENRAKNYPTFERVQAKIREVGYRMERGQVFVTRKFGSLNKRAPQELQPVPESTIKRFKLDDAGQSEAQDEPENKDDAPTVMNEIPEEDIEHIDENEKVFSDNEEDDKSDAENDEKNSVQCDKSDDEDGKDSSKEAKDDEAQISEDEASEIEDMDLPQIDKTKAPVGAFDYDSDRSWSEGLQEDEEMVEKQAESQPSTSDKLIELAPIVDYGSDVSWSEEVKEEDAGDAEIQPKFSPPKELNLIDQLGFFKPQNPKQQESRKISESEDETDQNKGKRSQNRPRRRRDRFSRKNRRDHPSRRKKEEKDDEEEDEDPEGLSAAIEAEVDEVSSKSGQKTFANNPVVQMATKRRICMRRASTITKRPTLLHMLLAEEMRHERNQLMQCVRFVVKNNFFLPK